MWLPPTTTAGIFERGAAMHVSSLVRRSVWQAIGGFDEQLQGSEDTAFWVAALESGARCGLVAEPLLAIHVRPGSRSAHAMAPQTHLAAVRAMAERWPNVREHAIEWTRTCLNDQRAYHDTLTKRVADAEATLSRLREEVQGCRRQLELSNVPSIDWGALSNEPASDCWGFDRGQPVDRYYIERFLARHMGDIRGSVLEIHDAEYTHRFGGTAVQHCDVVDIDPLNTDATIVADLTVTESLPPNRYDCCILTQVLTAVTDVQAAVQTIARALKPDGVLLCTVSSVNRIARAGEGEAGDYWRFTPASLRHALASAFEPDAFDVNAYGNAQACAALLHGLASHELRPATLEATDDGIPLIVAARAVKRHRTESTAVSRAVLCYHRLRRLYPDPHRIAIAADQFEAHLDALQAAFDVVPLEALWSSGGLRPRIALTFDDGYVDHLDVAAEALNCRGLPGTFFLTTAGARRPQEYWWDTLTDLFLEDYQVPEALQLQVGGRTRAFDTRSSEGRRAAHDWLVEGIPHLDAPSMRQLLNELVEWSGRSVVRDERRAMTEADIRQLAARPGLRIGAHTVHHLRLPTQAAATQMIEMRDCRRTLEEIVGAPVTDIAYPYGATARLTEEIARALGFARGWSVGNRPLDDADSTFALPRVEVRDESAAALVERLGAMLRA
jgi:peptidoglycan/xylan/chitin deacetylase (PgdA/CDA1 family)